MSIEKICGDNGAYTTGYISSPNIASGILFTAGWSGAASSVECTTLKVTLRGWDSGSANIKGLIWSSGGTLLGTSNIQAYSLSWDTNATITCTFASPVTIAKGTQYRLGFVRSANYEHIVVSGSGSQPEQDNQSSYTTPANWSTPEYSGSYATAAIWLEGETAGAGAASLIAKPQPMWQMIGR